MTSGMCLLVITRILVDLTLLGYPNRAVGVAKVVEKVFLLIMCYLVYFASSYTAEDPLL